MAAPARADDAVGGLRAPAGFEVTQFAGDELAHDIYSMTVNARGEVVVSGAGYVRALLDTDGDGTADTIRQFADGPATGAQGMYFDGTDLICTGDAGLIRYHDANGDGKADGPPETLIKMRAGGEHHAHAVRKGPDGCWYVLCGNDTGIDESYVTLPNSPVKKPEAGVLLRIKPDFSGSEVFCHGYRNAYDFAFHPQGDIFVYDSDGERDVSLPWYRPTRVFMALPGSHAGWVSRSWKRPNYYPDMPPVVGSFGRGSPTGVECYRHFQFPEVYRGAVFIADWTFGRVIALPLERDGAVFQCEKPIDFLTATGDFGFAPTDLAVAPDGSLLVSVGGRGTKGGVYRVRWKDAKPWAWPEPKTDKEKLNAVLSAPQPLSSWSRAKWGPRVEALGREAFFDAAGDRNSKENFRLRAIDVLTDRFGGLSLKELDRFMDEQSPAVRAQVLRSTSRTGTALRDLEATDWFVGRKKPSAVVQSVAKLFDAAPSRERISLPADGMIHSEQFLWQTLHRLSDGEYRPKNFWYLHFWAEQQMLRFFQITLGDMGPDGGEKLPPVFDGYRAQADLDKRAKVVTVIRDIVEESWMLENADDPKIRRELVRLYAMLQTADRGLFAQILGDLDDDSDPIEDIHYLICTARMPVERTAEQREQIARALVRLEPKIAARKLPVDSNWDDRIGEMYAAHGKLDPQLPATVARQAEFGWPGHVIFLPGMSKESRRVAVAAFVRRIEADADYAWSPEIVALLAESGEPRHRELLRGQFDNYSVRGAVLRALAKRPEAEDRGRFLAGLESPEVAVIAASLSALEKLGWDQPTAEAFALLDLARRLGADRREYELRERAVQLLRRSAGTDDTFGFITGTAGHNPQREALGRWERHLQARWPQEAKAFRLLADADFDLKSFTPRLAKAAALDGDATRGERVFEVRACARCHGGRRAVGPDLAGVTKRFSRDDLFTAILAPDRDVSPRYATTTVLTTEGKSYTGLIVYESVDGLLLRDASGETVRIERGQVEHRRRLTKSLMPAGLLKDITPRDLADLYAYLKTLGS